MSQEPLILQAEIERRGIQGIKLSLDRMKAAMQALDHPERRIGRTIIIAGTNGKGSVAAFLDATLRAAGHTVALYTSPHLVSYTERLVLCGERVEASRLDDAVRRVLEVEAALPGLLTGFELITAASFLCMADEQPAFSVVEVGLGGRLDATNVVEPEVSIITPLGMDHMRFLGPDLASITREKLGVTRPGGTNVVARQKPEAERIIRDHCGSVGGRLLMEGTDFCASGIPERWSFEGLGCRIEGLSLSLTGHYQVQNAGIAAAAAATLLPVDACRAALRTGLGSASWPGRFDLRLAWGTPVLLDGGHNLPAIEALAGAWTHRYPHRPAVLYAAKEDKDVAAILPVLERIASRLLLTSPGRINGHDPADLARLVTQVPVEVHPDPAAAFRRLAAIRGGPHLCCGSLFLVGYCLDMLASTGDHGAEGRGLQAAGRQTSDGSGRSGEAVSGSLPSGSPKTGEREDPV